MDSSTTSVWPTTWRDEPVDPRKVVGFNWFAHGGPKPNQTKRGWCVAGVSLRGLQRCAPSLSSITPFSVSSSLPALERNSDATPSSSSTLLVLLGTAACCIWLNGNKANRIMYYRFGFGAELHGDNRSGHHRWCGAYIHTFKPKPTFDDLQIHAQVRIRIIWWLWYWYW